MASTNGTQSTAPPNPDEGEKSGSEVVKPAEQESADESFTKSVSSSVEPMREDQVQNAVKFLSHPKVRGSPIIHRRSFLEKKGLTREEIDEAFRRVPDPPSNTTVAGAAASSQAAAKTPVSTSLQPQAPITTPQHASASLGGVPATSTYKFQWSHAFFTIGLLAASGAGTAVVFKNAILPRFKAWIRKVVKEEHDAVEKEVLKQTSIEEAAEAAKAAASAAAIMAKTSQELLNARTEEGKHFEAFKDLLNAQMEEMKSMRDAVHKLENTRETMMSHDKQIGEHKYASGNGEFPSAFTSAVPSGAPYSKSYMELISAVQRGETPPGVKEINDLPPNPNQPLSNPRVSSRIKPWEVIQQDQRNRNLGFLPRTRTDGYPAASGNGQSSQINGKSIDTSEYSWDQKTVKITEVEPQIEEEKTISYGSRERRGVGWVPPKPPTVVIPEAAVAIRQPKSTALKQQIENVTRKDNTPSMQVEGEHLMTQHNITEDGAAGTSFLADESGSSGSGAIISNYNEIEEEPVDVEAR